MTQRSDAIEVLVFARAPRPGQTKTRLVPALGAEGAAALHARFIERTLAVATAAGVGVVRLYGAPADDAFLQACAVRHGIDLHAQAGGDLGTRMHRALAEAACRGRAALIVGTDCPCLTSRHVADAAAALVDGCDAVFIPAEDGGYALVGAARADARLFQGIAWSTASVMEETRSRMRALDWTWRELETLWDVDTPADYQRFIYMQRGLAGNSGEAYPDYMG